MIVQGHRPSIPWPVLCDRDHKELGKSLHSLHTDRNCNMQSIHGLEPANKIIK